MIIELNVNPNPHSFKTITKLTAKRKKPALPYPFAHYCGGIGCFLGRPQKLPNKTVKCS
jgi:hypothetical protein